MRGYSAVCSCCPKARWLCDPDESRLIGAGLPVGKFKIQIDDVSFQ
jgi:hypothetical protein